MAALRAFRRPPHYSLGRVSNMVGHFIFGQLNLLEPRFERMITVYQTIAQIREKHDSDWVFMINCEEGHHGTIAGGEVVLHSINRDVVVRGMEKIDYKPSLTYFGYVGKIPEGTSVIL